MKTATIGLALVLFALPAAVSDEIILQDGTRYEGKVVSADDRVVVIRTYDLVEHRVEVSAIQRAKRGPSLFDQYEQKKKRALENAGAWAELGTWCKRHGLAPYAKEAFEKAIELDPENRAAREALGWVRKDDAWVSRKDLGEIEYEGEWMTREKAAARYLKTQVVILDLRAVYPGDATREQLVAFGERVRRASAYSWRLTHSQMYVRSVVVEDQGVEGSGHLNIAKGTWDSMRIRPGVYGAAGTTGVEVAGQMLEYTFLHESMHWLVGVPDEYTDDGQPACPPCIMSAHHMADAFCDGTDHVDEGPNCWQRIVEGAPKVAAARYRRREGEAWQVRYPNPYQGVFELPPTEVTIRDK